MGLSVEVVGKPPKPVPEEVAKVWAREWAKEGKKLDWQRFSCRRGGRWLCRGGGWWKGPSLMAWSEQEDELRDYERLCESAEAFV